MLCGLLSACISGATNQGADGTATLSPGGIDPLEGGAVTVDTEDNAAGANQVLEPPPITSNFPALDANLVQGDANALLGYAGAEGVVPDSPNQSIVVRARPFECLDARGLDTNALFVQLWRCNNTDVQAFTFQPDGHVQLAVKLPGTGSPNYCLAAGGGNDVGFAVCADDANQRWAAGGHLLQAQLSGACLARQDGTLSKTILGLTSCRRDDARQSWAVGEPNALALAAAASNPTFPVGPALPVIGQSALVGYARLTAPPAVSQPLDVALRQGLQVNLTLGISARTVIPRLAFYAEAEQVVFQPDGHLESAKIFKRSVPGCLGAHIDAVTRRPTLTVDNCSNDPSLGWSVSGHNLQHTATKMCLAFDETLWTDRVPALKFCDATDVRQSWAMGQHGAMRAEAQAAQEGYTIAQLCKVIVTPVEPKNPNANVRWALNRFGGTMSQFRDAQQAALSRACATMYGTSRDVLPVPPILLQFEELEGARARTQMSPQRVITYGTNTDWSALGTTYIPGVLVHEAAHVHDYEFFLGGTNYGQKMLLEGYADWVAYRSGSAFRKQFKGGGWNDGYAASNYFLFWLDAKYPPTTVGSRFTERAKAAGLRLAPHDPNWLQTWVVKETSKNMDQLWRDYQASF